MANASEERESGSAPPDETGGGAADLMNRSEWTP